jgi:hypothetical protein
MVEEGAQRLSRNLVTSAARPLSHVPEVCRERVVAADPGAMAEVSRRSLRDLLNHRHRSLRDLLNHRHRSLRDLLNHRRRSRPDG